MKLHSIAAGATIYIRKKDTKVFSEYTTKEEKTYFMEQFRDLLDTDLTNKYEHYMNLIEIKDQPELVLERPDYVFLSHDGFEAIVPTRELSLYVNSGD